MTTAVLSMGSNMGDRIALLRTVVDHFADRTIALSPVFSTPAWGPVEQDDFDNAILIASDPNSSEHDWLRQAHELERAGDRVRAQRWGPRTLDVDVVAVFDGSTPIISDDPILTLPHPRAHERAFVMVPWLAADPQATLTDANGNVSVADICASLDESGDIRQRDIADWPVRTLQEYR